MRASSATVVSFSTAVMERSHTRPATAPLRFSPQAGCEIAPFVIGSLAILTFARPVPIVADCLDRDVPALPPSE